VYNHVGGRVIFKTPSRTDFLAHFAGRELDPIQSHNEEASGDNQAARDSDKLVGICHTMVGRSAANQAVGMLSTIHLDTRTPEACIYLESCVLCTS
jgi:hypothetical protein